MSFNARCWTQPVIVLAVVMIFLSACATVGIDGCARMCPPVVEYSQAEPVRVADEVAALPVGELIAEWLAD